MGESNGNDKSWCTLVYTFPLSYYRGIIKSGFYHLMFRAVFHSTYPLPSTRRGQENDLPPFRFDSLAPGCALIFPIGDSPGLVTPSAASCTNVDRCHLHMSLLTSKTLLRVVDLKKKKKNGLNQRQENPKPGPEAPGSVMEKNLASKTLHPSHLYNSPFSSINHLLEDLAVSRFCNLSGYRSRSGPVQLQFRRAPSC